MSLLSPRVVATMAEYDDQDGGGKASPPRSPRRKKPNNSSYTGSSSMASVAASAYSGLPPPTNLFGNNFGDSMMTMTGAYNNGYMDTGMMYSAYNNNMYMDMNINQMHSNMNQMYSHMPFASAAPTYTPPTLPTMAALPPQTQARIGPNNDTVASSCSWSTSSTRCICRGALQLFLCCALGCGKSGSHMCQSEWENEIGNNSREVDVGKRYCPRHHPYATLQMRSTGLNRLTGGLEHNGGNGNDETGTLVGGGVNRDNNNDLGGHVNDGDGADDNPQDYSFMDTPEDAERAWLDSLSPVMNVRKTYDDVIKAEGANKLASTVDIGNYACNIQILLTMAQGALTDGEMQMSRLDDYVKKKWIKKGHAKTTVILMSKEIIRRHEVIKQFPFHDIDFFDADSDIKEVSNDEDAIAKFLKRPASTGSAPALKEVLGCRCKLYFKTEKAWIVNKIDEVLDKIAAYHDQQQLERHRSGDNLNVSRHTLLRLIEGMYSIVSCVEDVFILFYSHSCMFLYYLLSALFEDKNRDAFLRQFDTPSREELDGRNSEDSAPDIWTLVSDDYNNPVFAPTSTIFIDLHQQFTQSMDLSLQQNEELMTPENAKKLMKNVWSLYKRASTNWSASGNGKEGRASNTQRFSNTNYDDDDEEDLGEIEYLDDDRWIFCNGNIAVAYFWGVVEKLRLSSFCLQNLQKFGLESGVPPQSARDSRATTGKKKDSLMNILEMIPQRMSDIMSEDRRFRQAESRKDERRHCEHMLNQAIKLKNEW